MKQTVHILSTTILKLEGPYITQLSYTHYVLVILFIFEYPI